MLNRRTLLAGTAGLVAAGRSTANAASPDIATASNAIDAAAFGVRPNVSDDQGKLFTDMLGAASDRNLPVFLPPGIYLVSNLTLPGRVRLAGIPGATRILYGGGGHLIMAERAEHIELSGLTFDGANGWLADHSRGLLDLRQVARLAFDDCQVIDSGKHGLCLEGVSGHVERCTISGATKAGIYSVEANGLAIRNNSVSDCANGGILVHRWQDAEDGTMITGNRVQRIGASDGGTGQNGNGINIFRAGNVIVSGNMVSDCVFSAIRANSASNVQITGNTCSRSGETALYCEFSFEGAVISNNIVDGAANGIAMANFNEGGRMSTCIGNIVRNLSIDGPYPAEGAGFAGGISAEADTTISGNVVENAPLYGLKLGWGPYLRNVVASANVIRRAGTGIMVSVVEGAGPAVIASNIIEGAPNGAIVGHRWTKPVTGDLASPGDAGFAHLTIEHNRTS